MGAELFQAEGRAVTSRKSANSPKNWYRDTSMNVMYMGLDDSSLYGFYMQPEDGLIYQMEILLCN
jgi:hypothetical protein